MIVITMPAYNEEGTIGKVIRDIKNEMDKLKKKYEIIVVDDYSDDKTVEIAKKSGAIVFSNNYKRGLAETFKKEIKKCLELKADIIVHTDSDGQYLARDIPELLKEVEGGYDLVLGSRFKGVIEEMPFIKRLGNKAFSRAISKITNVKITDAQTGLRAFTRKLAEEVNIISDHTYTQEQIIKAINQNFKVKEVPVYFAKRYGKSKLIKNPFEYALKAWINIFRIYRDYKPLKFFGISGSILFSVGFIIGVWLLYLFVATGSVSHLPSVMLSVLFMSIGLQIILFGFLADMKR